MSNYINKSNGSYLTKFGNVDEISFKNTKTDDAKVSSLIRNISASSDSRRRAFSIYQTMASIAITKPDSTGTVYHTYSDIADIIFTPFINGYGKFDKNFNVFKITNDIRIKLITQFKNLTNCHRLNVVFTKSSSTYLSEEIEFFFNDAYISAGDSFKFKFGATGITLSDKSTITMVIPIRYIENIIEQTCKRVISDFHGKDVKLESMDLRVKNAVSSKIQDKVGKRIYENMIAALYKEFIFNNFATSTVRLCKQVGIVNIDTATTVAIQGEHASCSNLRLDQISNMLNSSDISEINPYMLLDMFEISDKETDFFVRNFLRSEDYENILTPNYYRLSLKKEDYLDEESWISASVIHNTKLNYMILALMIITKSSIKEIDRVIYVDRIQSAVKTALSYSTTSVVTNNKDDIAKEIFEQLNLMNLLSSNIIKLKKINELISKAI